VSLSWERFERIEPLAQGGMGAVFRAFDPRAGREVALKVLRTRRATAVQAERLRREALALARLNHPHLLPIHGLEEAPDGSLVLVMPLVSGRDLQTELEERGPLAGPAAAALVQRVGEAVAHSHERGVLHRDIKPENVLLPEPGRPVLTDFGLARLEGEGHSLTQTGRLLGTPAYLAPEQGLGLPVGPAADVYGLGALLFSCLTARAPREPTSLMALLDELQQRVAPPSPSTLPGSSADRGLDAICARAMHPDPAARYADAQALVDDLAAYARGELRPRPRLVIPLAVGALSLAAAATLFAKSGAGSLSPAARQAQPLTSPTPAATSSVAPGTWAQRARRRLERNDFQGALVAADALEAEDPARALRVRALALANLGRLEEALEQAERGVDLSPRDGNAFWVRALIYEMRFVGSEDAEALDPSLRDFRAALRWGGLTDERVRQVRRKIAQLLRTAGRIEEAQEAYERLVELEPDVAAHHTNLGFLAARLGRAEVALGHVDRALELEPDDPDALLNRSGLLSSLGRRPEAWEALRGVLAQLDGLTATQGAQAYFMQARLYLEQGAKEQALEALRRSAGQVNRDKGGDHLFYSKQYALALEGYGRGREALQCVDRYLKHRPEARAAALRFEISLRLRDVKEARHSLDLLQRLEPRSLQWVLLSAQLEVQQGQLGRAEALLVSARDDPARSRRERAEIRLGLGGVLVRQRRYEDALAALRDVASADLDAPHELLWLRGGALHSLGRSEAREALEAFVRSAPQGDARLAQARAWLRGR